MIQKSVRLKYEPSSGCITDRVMGLAYAQNETVSLSDAAGETVSFSDMDFLSALEPLHDLPEDPLSREVLTINVGAQRSRNGQLPRVLRNRVRHSSQFENNYVSEMCSGSEAGSYLRLIDFVYHSTLGLRVIKQKRRGTGHAMPFEDCPRAVLGAIGSFLSTLGKKCPRFQN